VEKLRPFVFSSLLVWLLALPNRAQPQTPGRQPRIVKQINEAQRQMLPGNTHPLARASFDRGAAPVDLPMDRMLLVLNRSTEQMSALQSLLDAQQNPSSSHYHKWLTPGEFGEKFGATDDDIQTITIWLESQGFRISRVFNGKTVIEFSGTASQVRRAFHTEIRKYVVNGEAHWANASDPQIPVALANVVAGVATLHNFTKKTQFARSAQVFEATYRAGEQPQFTSGSSHALSPGDYATIYNLKPLHQAGIVGLGRTIAVVARTNININDVYQFRNAFHLTGSGPQIQLTGADPGNLGGDEEAEAVLDMSWAGATAPDATAELVVSKTTNATDGVDLSEAYIVDRNFADVMTESFGDCEANFTQAQASLYLSLAAQAAAQGITYVVASGDSGSAGCNQGSDNSSNGVSSVNILASNPYVVAVGGTEFNEDGSSSLYWDSSNSSSGSSALSYMPESVWNESCTIPTGTNPCSGSNTPGLWAGGGGASSFYSKPLWQTGVAGIPDDGKRDVPDISLTAAGHDPYLLCLRGSCTPDSRGLISFYGFAGTSAATPSFAGMIATILQKLNGRLGSVNYALYLLAAHEDLSQCNGSNTAGVTSQYLYLQ
jgi:subtilase family serine protease